MNPRPATTWRAAWILILAGLAPPSFAEELRLQSTLSGRSEYNDNPNLVADGADPVLGLIADVGLQAAWSGESWRWDFSPRLVARRYTGQDELDSRDLLLGAGYLRTTERGHYRLDAGYGREYTLTSQFAATGTVDQNIPRESLTAGASATRSLTRRTSLEGAVSYQDVTYENGIRLGLFDYQYWLASASVGHGVAEQTSVNVIARMAQLQTAGTGVRSRELTLGLGVDHAWNQRWSMSLSAGPTISDINGRDPGTGISYRASLIGTWERSELSIAAQHLLSPAAAQGRLQVRDALNATWVHRLRQSLNLTAYLNGELYSDVENRPAAPQDNYGTISAGASLDWRPADAWSWRLAVSHTLRDDDGSPQSNVISAGFSWRGRARSKSF